MGLFCVQCGSQSCVILQHGSGAVGVDKAVVVVEVSDVQAQPEALRPAKPGQRYGLRGLLAWPRGLQA